MLLHLRVISFVCMSESYIGRRGGDAMLLPHTGRAVVLACMGCIMRAINAS
jgi:hypothetical protein